jgi:hypothetical protein
MFIFLAAIRDEFAPFANVSIQTTDVAFTTRMDMSRSLVRRTRIITVIRQHEKRQLVISTALISKKMKLTILIHYFLLKRPPFQKMTEQATKKERLSRDCCCALPMTKRLALGALQRTQKTM